jgi:hypothetical protein
MASKSLGIKNALFGGMAKNEVAGSLKALLDLRFIGLWRKENFINLH